MKDVTENKHGGDALSHSAWLDNLSVAGKLRREIVRLAKERQSSGITTYEITQVLGIRTQTASARMSELKRDDILFDSGRRRKTDTGSLAAVLILQEFFDE